MFVSVLGKEKNDGARSEMLQSFNILQVSIEVSALWLENGLF